MNENQSINQSIASVVKKKIGNLDRRRAVCQREGRNKEGRKKVCGLGGGEKAARTALASGSGGAIAVGVFLVLVSISIFWVWQKISTHHGGMCVEKERRGKEREGRGFRYPYLPAALRRLLGDTTYNITWYKKKERKDRGTRETPQAFFHGHWCRNGH